MSILFLRVDEADQNSSIAEISHTLNCKKSMITLLLCLQRAKIKVPYDIRRMIAVYCTTPTPTSMLCSVSEYWIFYSTHQTTQKYNPLICTTGQHINSDGILLLVWFKSPSYYHTLHKFRHPFTNMLKEVAAVSFGIIRTELAGFIYSSTDNVYTITKNLWLSGNYIVGIEHDDNITSAVCYCGIIAGNMPHRIVQFNLKSQLNVNMFDLSSNIAAQRPDNVTGDLDKAYMQKYPVIHGIDGGFIEINYQSPLQLHLKSKHPIDFVNVLHGYVET